MNKTINIENAPNYFWGNECKSYLLTDSENLSVKLETMSANTSEQLHFHSKSTQVFFIIQGIAVLEIDSLKYELKPNDSITIFPNQKHYIKNETQFEIKFLVISQPNTNNDRTNLTDI